MLKLGYKFKIYKKIREDCDEQSLQPPVKRAISCKHIVLQKFLQGKNLCAPSSYIYINERDIGREMGRER